MQAARDGEYCRPWAYLHPYLPSIVSDPLITSCNLSFVTLKTLCDLQTVCDFTH